MLQVALHERWNATALTRWQSQEKVSAFTHRRNRLNTEFHLPKSAGKSRHGQPVRTIQSPASTKSRGLGSVRPGLHTRPKQCRAIRAHCVSINVVRIKVASPSAPLNQPTISLQFLNLNTPYAIAGPCPSGPLDRDPGYTYSFLTYL